MRSACIQSLVNSRTELVSTRLFGLLTVSLASELKRRDFGIAAAENDLPPELPTQGWEEITFDGKKFNRYVSCGADCIEIKTDASVSMIGRPVTADLSRVPALSWEWKVENPVVVSDLTIKGEDDRAVAVYVTFPYDPKTATLIEKLLRRIAQYNFNSR